MATIKGTILVRQLGAVATAAVGLTQRPHILMVGLFAGLGDGLNALVARFRGAGEEHRADWLIRSAFIIRRFRAIVWKSVRV